MTILDNSNIDRTLKGKIGNAVIEQLENQGAMLNNPFTRTHIASLFKASRARA
jgi:hypothetical protein